MMLNFSKAKSHQIIFVTFFDDADLSPEAEQALIDSFV